MPPNANKSDDPAADYSVPVTAIAMKLLDLRLKQAGAIITSVIGEFTAQSRQEIAVLRAGGALEIYRILSDAEDDKEGLKLVARLETRSVLRCCTVIRLTGEKRDLLAVGADGGTMSILDFDGGTGKVLHCTVFGKTGKFSRS
jgi:hypothetical protein